MGCGALQASASHHAALWCMLRDDSASFDKRTRAPMVHNASSSGAEQDCTPFFPFLFPHTKLISYKTLYGEVEIGATNSIRGIYTILAALRVLRQWVDTDFRAWFNAILVPTGT